MELSPRDFARIARLVEGHCGIRLPDAKRTMVEGRLRRRVRALGLDGMDAYCRLLLDGGGLDSEFTHLIDAVTTNKTDFFREPAHFDRLAETMVPDLAERLGAGLARPLRVWSAACSSGQEPYTLAMVLGGIAPHYRGFDYQVLATDICTEVLATATRAIYPGDQAEDVPMPYRKACLMRSRDRACNLMRVAPEIRAKVAFRRLNLLDGTYPWGEPVDVVFCRNVLIYFDKPTQQKVLSFLCRHLVGGGYLVLGHSETLHGLDLPVHQVFPSVYATEAG